MCRCIPIHRDAGCFRGRHSLRELGISARGNPGGHVGRDGRLADLAIVAVCTLVLGWPALFWSVILRSERAHRYTTDRSGWILWVALDGLGVGDELGVTEFAWVFFVAHILGSLAPTPGGVGVIEAGVTGALVAAAVPTDVALAGVLGYRFITGVLQIVIGMVWYLIWRSRPNVQQPGVSSASGSRAGGPVRSGRDAVH
jgi:hypothetical protein